MITIRTVYPSNHYNPKPFVRATEDFSVVFFVGVVVAGETVFWTAL